MGSQRRWGRSDIHFICVATPQSAGSHAANADYVENAVAAVARAMTHDGIEVGKSTVPVGTAVRLRELLDTLVPDGITPPSWSGTPS